MFTDRPALRLQATLWLLSTCSLLLICGNRPCRAEGNNGTGTATGGSSKAGTCLLPPPGSPIPVPYPATGLSVTQQTSHFQSQGHTPAGYGGSDSFLKWVLSHPQQMLYFRAHPDQFANFARTWAKVNGTSGQVFKENDKPANDNSHRESGWDLKANKGG